MDLLRSLELAETSSCACSGVPQSSTHSGYILIYNCTQNQLYTKVSAALSPNHQIHVLPLISCPSAKQPLLRLLYLIPHPQRQCFWGVPAWLPRPLCLPHREDEAEAGSGNAERERRTQGGRARKKKKKKLERNSNESPRSRSAYSHDNGPKQIARI